MGVSNPIFARVYTRASAAMDRRGGADHRRRLLAGLHGRVLELGAGHGANFAYYPDAVTEVVAVEPEPYLRRAAQVAAVDAPVPVEVRDGLADDLPVGDDEFDAAVVSLVLCSVPEQHTALTELRRVLRPGGELRFYEHVVASTPRLRWFQARVDVVWPYLTGGCHTSRDTLAAIDLAGFEVTTHEAFRFPETALAPVSPHVLGRAVPRQSRRRAAT